MIKPFGERPATARKARLSYWQASQALRPLSEEAVPPMHTYRFHFDPGFFGGPAGQRTKTVFWLCVDVFCFRGRLFCLRAFPFFSSFFSRRGVRVGGSTQKHPFRGRPKILARVRAIFARTSSPCPGSRAKWAKTPQPPASPSSCRGSPSSTTRRES